MRSSWLEPDVLKGTSPVLRGGRHGDVFSLTRPIGAIFNAIRYKAKYVLDADIAKCFDRIDQEKLLHKLNTFPTMRRIIKSWLKAGVMDGKELFPTSEGTPQGGVISPLLANVALHGMENRIKQYVGSLKKLGESPANRKNSVSLIRYADDFVILHKDLTVVQGCQAIISDWLKDMGLELKPSKTRLAHTVKGEASPYDGNLIYWSKRRGESLELPTRVATLIKKQKGICPWCNLHFREEDVMEVDHNIPKSKGGKDTYYNLQLLHRHCHDTKTTLDGSPGTKSGCNSAEPKPPRKLEMVNGKWVMRCV